MNLPVNLDAVYFRGHGSVIQVAGADRLDFLHRLTTQSLKLAGENDVRPFSLLGGKGDIIGVGLAWVRAHDVLLIVDNEDAQSILDAFERMHFGEDLNFSNLDSAVIDSYGEFEGLSHESDLREVGAGFTGRAVEIGEGWWQLPGETLDPLARVIFREGKSVNAEQKFGSGRRILSREEAIAVRSWLGLFRNDRTSGNIILEFGLDHFIHRNKGCYPGQEVVERIYTYGRLAKMSVVLIADRAENLPQAGAALFNSSGDEVGRVTSAHPSLSFIRAVVKRQFEGTDKFLSREPAFEFYRPENEGTGPKS